MSKRQNQIPLRDLNLTDRFLFAEVSEQPQAHQDMLSIIMGKEVQLFEKPEIEKELRVSPLIRSIRMDVITMDEESNIYNTEMQNKKRDDLAKRSRYYQSLIDTQLLEPGVPNYNLLNPTKIIFITTFDLFKQGKYKYTFETECEEVPGLKLGDGTTRIFLNTKGTNNEEVSEELLEFLRYIEETTDEVAKQCKSPRIQRIHECVCRVKTSEEVGVRYMQSWEEKYYEREEGREEGLKEGLKAGRAEGQETKLKELITKKLAKGKTVAEIADALEETEETIQKLIKELEN